MKQQFILAHDIARGRAIDAVKNAPAGFSVEVKEPSRNLEQNAMLWALLGEVAEQVDWYGNKLTAEEWKAVFSSSLKKQKVVPGLEGGFVVCGQSTSRMGKREFSDLIELIRAFGAERGVKFGDEREAA